MTSSGGKPPLRLLALDGGGIRGLSELLVLKGVMHRLMVEENMERRADGRPPLSSLPKPCDYFDLIGGTGTGGIIALMLGRLRMDVDTAIKYYTNLAAYVFSDLKQWGDGRFKSTKLEDAIKSAVRDITGDSESPLLESDEAGVCRTFVCAMNAHHMSANIPTLFRTYQSREIHTDCKIWEAARATSAAPTFFRRIEIGTTLKQPFIDGGLGRNNPSRLVLDEAKHLFGSRQIGLLLSIGSGTAKVISIKNSGIFQRIVPTDVIDAVKAISSDCEATHEAMVDLFGNSPNTYFRLNVDQGIQDIEFLEWEKLGNVGAHTTQYMNRKDVDAKLGFLVNVILAPRRQITIEQLISPRPPVEFDKKPHELDTAVIKQRCHPEIDRQYLDILCVLDVLAVVESVSDVIHPLRMASLGLVDIMTTSRADIRWQDGQSDELVNVTAALSALAWIFQRYQSALVGLPGMVAEYTKNMTDFLNLRRQLAVTQNHNREDGDEIGTPEPQALTPNIASVFLIETSNDMLPDAGGDGPSPKGVFVTDFNGRRAYVPQELCACWLDLCTFLEIFLRGEEERYFVATRKFGVRVPDQPEVGLLSGAAWDSWIGHSNQDRSAPCIAIDLYAIINDESDSCPRCKILDPVQYPLPPPGNFQQCQSCQFTFLESYREDSGSEEPSSDTIDLGSLAQTSLVSPVQSVGYYQGLSDPALPSDTQSSTQASQVNAAVESPSVVNTESGPSVPKHVQVVRRRKPYDYEEDHNPASRTDRALPTVLPRHRARALITLKLRSPFDLFNVCHVLYTYLLFRLPDRYRRNALSLSESQTLGRRFTSSAWKNFHHNFKYDISYFGTAAGVAFSVLFTTLQISSAADDPIVRTVVQLSIVCLFFGLVYSFVLWVTFGTLSEVEGIIRMNEGIELAQRNTFWDLWFMLAHAPSMDTLGVHLFCLLPCSFSLAFGRY